MQTRKFNPKNRFNKTGPKRFGPNKNQNTQQKSAPAQQQKNDSDKKNSKRSGSFQYGKHGVRRKPKNPPQAELKPEKKSDVPKIEPGVLRIIPLGGVEEIGKNMTAIEIGEDIIVIDAGMQFKTEDTPGIDYIIPNTTYLEERKDKIRAMFVTHGHLEHIGGIPLVMSRIGNPPLYSRNLSILVMKKRQEEFPHLPALNAHIVETN